MNNNNQVEGARKALYLFLTSILGMLLFVTLHRALTLLYLVLLSYNYESFSFGLSFLQHQAINYLTLVAAMFLGGWYGVWLGMHWYEIVYEKIKAPQWFGLSGKLFDHSQNMKASSSSPQKSAFTPVAEGAKTYKLSDLRRHLPSWNMEDLARPSAPSVAVVSKNTQAPKTNGVNKLAAKSPAAKNGGAKTPKKPVNRKT